MEIEGVAVCARVVCVVRESTGTDRGGYVREGGLGSGDNGILKSTDIVNSDRIKSAGRLGELF